MSIKRFWNTIKNNVWALYWGIALFSFTLLIYSMVVSWHDTLSQRYQQLAQSARLVSRSTNSVFANKEMLLDVLIGELDLQPQLTPENLQRMNALFDRMMATNGDINGFGLAGVNGRMVSVSDNMQGKPMHNLATHKDTAATFAQTLQSDAMVVGRTYFHQGLQGLIIPIRKRIVGADGEVLAVITAGIRVGSQQRFFEPGMWGDDAIEVAMLRTFDRYYQLHSGFADNESAYTQPINYQAYLDSAKMATETMSKTVAELRSSDNAVFYEHQQDNGLFIAAALFDRRYQLWSIVKHNKSAIVEQFWYRVWYYPVFFMLFLLVLSLLFRASIRVQQQQQQLLLDKANHDSLTRLPNRNYLEDTMSQMMSEPAQPFSLLYLDMDHFKSVNDSFGHEIGDKVLQQLGARLLQQLPSGGSAVRYGGDEFILLIPTDVVAQVEPLCQQLVQQLCEPVIVAGIHCHLGVSIGVASYPTHGTNMDQLLRSADIAMYEAKKYRNRICFFEPALQQCYLHRIAVERQLRSALDKQELYPVYQPQVDAEGQIYGVEVLLRWRNAELGMVPPNEFIGVAERAGLMLKIGQFVMERSLQQLAGLHCRNGQPLQIALNISVCQFVEKAFIEQLLEAINRNGIECGSLTVEITENLFIEDVQQLLPSLQQLRSHGIKISMDDFGTGYSSLSLLRQLPLDELKIDKSFIDELGAQHSAASLVKSIIDIGRNLELTLVAEGVETQQQWQQLQQQGCSHYQGYLFAKPLTFHQLSQHLSVD
ncbi:EAL domain-containing protein [uncultured Ferrimonas sp.]|uniref:bifunctional diguanylate cyclase/phosphodiesterase n=1 Tax=uncultured Ferrimonas sp. TaxID=432640 RepID=UPI002632C34B|nr:EAL domain-containing protein [uncultured Ferrimonas sp.]